MKELKCDVAVVGAGPAGLAAAAAAKREGAERVVVIERDRTPGGILLQCIHPASLEASPVIRTGQALSRD